MKGPGFYKKNLYLVDVAEGDSREDNLVKTGTGRVDGDDNFAVEKVECDDHCGDGCYH